MTMTRWHDDHAADEEASKTPSPADALAERLRRLKREAKEAELERQLSEDKGSTGRRKGKG
jgi:hypothetical protein